MSDCDRYSFDLATSAETRHLARRVAPHLRAGDVLTLAGPIGAGKTEFARAVIRSIAGAEIEVPSPSYTLVQTYDLPCLSIAHLDLYRLGDASELAELAIDELAADHVLLIEWPERAGEALPPATLTIRFEILGDGRRVSVTDHDRRLVGMGMCDA